MKIQVAIGLVFTILAAAGCTSHNNSVLSDSSDDKTQAEPVSLRELEPQAMRILESSLKDEEPRIRCHAIESVVACNRNELMPLVVQLLDDESFPVRFAAAMGVGDARYIPAKEPVRTLLLDDNLNVQLAAAYAMGKLGEDKYESRLVKALSSTDQTVRGNAVMLMGKLGKKEHLEPLRRTAITPNQSPKIVMQAVEAMARLGDIETYRKIWPLLISKYADDRQLAIRAMGALGTPDAEDAITTMLDDQVTEVRLCAAEQLGRMENRVGRPEVADYLDDGRTDAYLTSKQQADFIAALAIGRIGGSELTRHLPRLLDSKWQHVRLNAAQSVLILVR